MTRPAIAILLYLMSASSQAQQWLTLEPRELPITISASGLIASADVSRFGPPPSRSWRTTITQIAREGQKVKPGDMLATFDNSGADDRVRELQGELAEAEGSLASFLETSARDVEQEKLDIADAVATAKKAALKADQPAGLIANIEYDKLVEDRRIAEDQLQRARARLVLSAQVRDARQQELEADIKRLSIQLQAAKTELDSFTLRADRDGLVIIGTDRQGVKLDVNSNVNPGIVVVELVNADDLQVQVEVPEHASAKLAIGQAARVIVDAAGGLELLGTVSAVANIVRRQSRNSQTMVRDVIVTFDEGDFSGLRPGMSSQVSIEIDRLENALSVPQTALVYESGKPGVELRSGAWQPVVLGARSDDEFIVVEGVTAGQEIKL